MMKGTAAAACGLLLLLPATWARAQLGGGMGRMGGRRGGGPSTKPEKPKVAEQAKTKKKKIKPKRRSSWGDEKPIQFFKLGGYFRVRSDVFHRFHLGLRFLAGSSFPPHARPLYSYSSSCLTDPGNKECDKNYLTTTNMRLHLEPQLNVHSRVRVKMTLDIFDNLVLGSTPEGYNYSQGSRIPNTPLNAFAATAEVPQQGKNSLYDAIQVKHIWGEVDLPFGRLMFGRMPSHWGTGMLANSGLCSRYAAWTVKHKGDPARCMDSDYGDSADRIMFATKIPWGLDLLVGFSWDFQASGFTSLNLNGEQLRLNPGQPFDLDPSDDVQQWVAFVARIDDPLTVKQRLAEGKVVFNYGTYWVFRRQKRDVRDTAITGSLGPTVLADLYAPRDAFAMIPDVWMRLNWGKLQLEFEGVLIWGRIKDLGDISTSLVKPDADDLKILQWGWVFKAQYSFLSQDALTIGLEIGQASGDDNLEGEFGIINYRNVTVIPKNFDNPRNSLFRFDPNYRVDLIFFRELMGTVYNATYFKAWAKYDIVKELTARVDIIYSLAMEPVSTPGNNPHYGVEIDADVEYRWVEAGFYVGIAYGVFFPLGALHRPGTLFPTDEKAKIAQTVQLRASIKFD